VLWAAAQGAAAQSNLYFPPTTGNTKVTSYKKDNHHPKNNHHPMKIKHNYIIGLLLGIFTFFGQMTDAAAQNFYRMKAEFTIKEKMADGKQQLTMGVVYYDKNTKKIIYDIRFPEKKRLLLQDTSMYDIATEGIKVGKLIKRQHNMLIPEFSMFHLVLNGELANFGLNKSFYAPKNVEKDGNMVITTWLPDAKMGKAFGKVMISNIDKKLNGVVIYNPKNEMVSKQVFRNYTTIKGCNVPQELVQILYLKEGKNYQVTTYKNIKINDTADEKIYNLPVPKP
jgi:hypothetical protein